MSSNGASGKSEAILSASLLARKGSATPFESAGAPDTAPESPAPSESSPSAPAANTLARPRILIVEDDLLNMTLMTDLFEGYGYQTLQAQNGLDAITTARAAQPDLIIMDIQLPKLSGLDAIRQLKSDPELTEIPVIAVSAMVRSAVDEMIRGGGFDGFVAKPFSVDGMLETVSRFLH